MKTPEEIAQQLQQHIDSLRAAGVEWTPSAPLPEIKPVAPGPAARTPAPPPATSVPLPTVPDASTVQTSLFASAVEPTAQAGSAEQRLAALDALRKRVAACTRCPQLASTRTQTVFGVG